MSLLTEKEKQYLQTQQVGRLATSGKTGVPHVVPTGFHLDPEHREASRSVGMPTAVRIGCTSVI